MLSGFFMDISGGLTHTANEIIYRKERQEMESMPMGLGLALAQNEQAMRRFAAMNKQEKQAVIDGTHRINSPQEMRAYVNALIRNSEL